MSSSLYGYALVDVEVTASDAVIGTQITQINVDLRSPRRAER